jgi:hypothetical protein
MENFDQERSSERQDNPAEPAQPHEPLESGPAGPPNPVVGADQPVTEPAKQETALDAGQTPQADTSQQDSAPVPAGEQSVEQAPNYEQEQQAENDASDEEVPDTSGLEPNVQYSPDQVPADGDNSQAELKEAPADDAQ